MSALNPFADEVELIPLQDDDTSDDSSDTTRPINSKATSRSSSHSGSQSPSPRTALLSPTVETGRLRRISNRDRFRRERERSHSTTPARDLLHLLVNEEYESRQTRKLLFAAFERLDKESMRAVEAERSAVETVERFRGVNNARIQAQQEAVRIGEELRLYKLQLTNAQREIGRAQSILREVEAQRDAAQERASDAVGHARRLYEEKMVNLAREEGRRLGFEEGLRRGRELAWPDGREEDGNRYIGRIAERAVDRITGDDGVLEEDEVLERVMEQPLPSHPSNTILRTHTPQIDSLTRGRSNDIRPTTDPTRSRSGTAASRRSLSDLRAIPPPIVIHNVQAPNSHIEIDVPPDNWIPTADSANGFLSMPPPHEMQPPPPSPSAQGSFSSLGERIIADRDRDLPPPPPSSDDGIGTRNPRHHRNSTGSGSTTMSRLGRDLSVLGDSVVGGPQRSRNLSVIPESPSRQASPGGQYARSLPPESPVRSPVQQTNRNAAREQEDLIDRQRLADELRYSNPSEAQERRQQGADRARSSSSLRNVPPRSRPPVSMPSPLSPQTPPSPHVNARPQREAIPPNFRPRRVNEEEDVSIQVVPPSQTPSDNSRGLDQSSDSGMLSPSGASRALPILVPEHPSITNPRSPTSPRASDANPFVPTSFTPNAPFGSQIPLNAPTPKSGRMSPMVLPPIRTSGIGEPSWERNTSPLRPRSGSGSPLNTRLPDSMASTSMNTLYPDPSATAAPLPPSTAGSPPTSAKLRRRSGSLNIGGRSQGPLSPTTPRSPAAMNTHIRRVPSTSSTGSYSRFDQTRYLDPAYLASAESLHEVVA